MSIKNIITQTLQTSFSEFTEDQASAVIEALKLEGFVLVPRVPTEEMIQIGAKANSECLNDNAPLGERLYRYPAIQVYAAMVAELEKGHEH